MAIKLTEAQGLESRRASLESLRQSIPPNERVVRAAIFNRDNFDDFLPISLLPTIWSETEGSEWDEEEGEHLPRPLMVYKAGGDRKLTFTLLLDMTTQPEGFGVERAIGWLQSAMRPQSVDVFQRPEENDVILSREQKSAVRFRIASLEEEIAETEQALRPSAAGIRFDPLDEDELAEQFERFETLSAYLVGLKKGVVGQAKLIESSELGKLVASRYTPKRLFLVLGDNPIPFYGAIDKLSITENLFVDNRVFRASVEVSMFELIESKTDFTVAGYNLPPTAVKDAAASRLTRAFERGRRAVTDRLDLD